MSIDIKLGRVVENLTGFLSLGITRSRDKLKTYSTTTVLVATNLCKMVKTRKSFYS